MPPADDPQSDRVSADLPVAPSSDAAPDAPSSAAGEPEGRSDASPENQPRRRRRRRRRRPLFDAATSAGSGAAGMSADETPSTANAAAVDLGVGDGSAEAGPTASAQSAPPTTGDRPHRRRRRRHRPPPHGLGSGLPPADRGAATQNAEGDGSQPESAASSELAQPWQRATALVVLHVISGCRCAAGGGFPARLACNAARRTRRRRTVMRPRATPRRARQVRSAIPAQATVRRPPPRIGEAAPAGHRPIRRRRAAGD